MDKSRSGFTIVELLIVIVVIAILAAISVVAYTGIQQRANNAKTVSAVTAYVRALNLYKADEGQYPPVSSCLGTAACDTQTYGVNGGGLNTTHLSGYLGSSIPTPATNRGEYSTGRQLGGAVYVWNLAGYGGTNNGGIGLYHQGSGSCPSVGGITLNNTIAYIDGSGRWCFYGMS